MYIELAQIKNFVYSTSAQSLLPGHGHLSLHWLCVCKAGIRIPEQKWYQNGRCWWSFTILYCHLSCLRLLKISSF